MTPAAATTTTSNESMAVPSSSTGESSQRPRTLFRPSNSRNSPPPQQQHHDDDDDDEEDAPPPSVFSRVVSGSIGSIVTALAVTPLEVVKVRQQAEAPIPVEQQRHLPPDVKPCSRGCGTFVFNNGLQECILPKSAVPYFDETGRLTEKARKSCWPTRNPTATTTSNHATNSTSHGRLGTFAMVRRIFINEGFTGIYAGLSPTLVMSVPSTVLYFTVYDEISSRLRQRQYHYHHHHDDMMHGSSNNHNNSLAISWWIPLVGGSSARLLTTLSVAPLELIRTRQASVVGGTTTPGTTTTTSSSTGLWSELKNIVKLEGAAALYKGVGPTLWRDVPFSAIYWLSVERLRELWKSSAAQRDTPPPSPLVQAGQAFINGAVSGMVAAAATTPFDVVKTRQQTMVIQQVEAVVAETSMSSAAEIVCHHDGAFAYRAPNMEHASGGGNSGRPTIGTFGLLHQIYDKEGVAGLWRGNQTRMIKIAPACAIMISCYELGKRLLD